MSTSLNKTCKACCQTKSVDEFTERRAICKSCRCAQIVNQRKEKQLNLTQEEPEPEVEQTSEIETIETPQIQEIQQDSYVYLLTSPEMESVQRYKIGKHTGTKEKLVSRYKTYLVDVIVLRFAKLQGNVDIHEKALHQLLATYRYKNSEWFIVDQQKILEVFDDYILKFKTALLQVALKEISMYNNMIQVTHNLLKQFLIENNLPFDELQKSNFDILETLKERSQNSLNLANLNSESYTS